MQRQHFFATAFALLTLSHLLFSADTSGLPACPPDWKVELIAEVPQLVHPSAVCVAPDGRVFVGQDPMDMASASDKPADYILCFHPDGKVNVFATNLYAVFGLSYLEGKLYVHHCPKVTVFRDDESIGKDPVDLFETNPRPWNGGFNDHIPANLHFAMDGYFYLATGDKGIYGAVGKDGSKAELRGGGIIRFRPDGTELEVYSSGTRNHLDVAINDETEMFTYDNTDDGSGWWTRVTHMVDRGVYGYPHDYKPQRPYTLWMIKDYGGGSPTGAIAYNEDALPAEYHGNLFMSEWGKGQLERFVVQRDGATYKILRREPFLKLKGKEFRPVGVDVSADGMSLYVADWNHGGWKNKLLAGRFLKATYTGKSQAVPKPAWYVPAALGKSVDQTTIDELIGGLRHSSERVRLAAQHVLARRGAEAVKKLTKVVADKSQPAMARVHAIWALDAIDRGASARAAIEKASRDENALLRRQAARQLGTRRAREAVNALTTLLQDSDKSVRFQAATALGRIADPKAVGALTRSLEEDDLFARYASFTALNHLGRENPSAWEKIAQGLRSDNTNIREGTLFTMRETFEKGNVDALASIVSSSQTPPETRAAALNLLAELHRKSAPWNGNWWGTQPVKSSPPPKTIDWEGTPAVLASINGALKDKNTAVQVAAIQGAEIARVTNAIPILAAMFEKQSEPAIRQAIVAAMGGLKGPTASAFISSILDRPESTSVLQHKIAAAEKIGGKEMVDALIKLAKSRNGVMAVNPIIEALGALKAVEAIPLIVEHVPRSNPEGQVALTALGKIGGEKAVQALVPFLSEADPLFRAQVVTALGSTKQKTAFEPLLKAWRDGSTRPEAIIALSQRPDIRALDAYLDGLVDKNSSVRDDSRKALQSIRNDALPTLEDRAAQGSLKPSLLAALQKVYEKNDQARLGPLFAKLGVDKSTDPVTYARAALKNNGDLSRGKAIFNDIKGVACIKCHKAEGQGGEVGPDLNSVGAKYSRAQIIEHILYPSRIILDGYQQTTVFTKDGDSQSGIVRGETADELTLLDTEGKKHVIARKQIESRKQSVLSLMPEGMQIGLSPQDFSDLVTYVESLKDQSLGASK